MRATSVSAMVILCAKKLFRKYLFKVLSQQLRSNLTTVFEKHLKSKISQTWINIGVKPARRHLTYYSILLFLSNKLSFYTYCF